MCVGPYPSEEGAVGWKPRSFPPWAFTTTARKFGLLVHGSNAEAHRFHVAQNPTQADGEVSLKASQCKHITERGAWRLCPVGLVSIYNFRV